MAERKYDLALFGATGFTGGLTAEYLAAQRARRDCAGRWSGATGPSWRRSRRGWRPHRRERRRPTCSTPTRPTAGALAEVAESARVVITTVGPYALYGEPLVAACAAAGTDYVDLTGEPEFVDRMWIAHHAEARADRRPPRPLLRLRLDPARPRRLLHGPAAARGRAAEGRRLRPHQRRVLRRHLPLGDQRLRPRPRRRSAPRKERRRAEPRPAGRAIHSAPARHPPRPASSAAGRCRCRRSTARSSAAPPPRWSATAPTSPTATTASPSTWPRVAALGRRGRRRSPLLAPLPPTRKLLLKLKSPGRGAERGRRGRKSWFKVSFVGEGGGKRVVTEVSGGDPGYGETSKMLAESALCLAFDELPETRRPGDHRGGDGRRAAGAAAASRNLLRGPRAGCLSAADR